MIIEKLLYHFVWWFRWRRGHARIPQDHIDRPEARWSTHSGCGFTFFNDDALFPGNGIGSGGRLTARTQRSPRVSSVENGQREEERNSLVGRIHVRVCRLRAPDNGSVFFAGWNPELDDTRRNRPGTGLSVAFTWSSIWNIVANSF